MGALRVDPIRSLGLLSPNYADLASPRVRTILVHYDQIQKEHQGEVGMAVGRGTSHISSASTCRNRRRYVTSPVNQRHEAVRIGISEKPSNP